MTVLAIETATVAVATALCDESALLGSFEVRAGRRHAELLHVAVAHLLEATGIGFGDLDGVAVDIGPGLFTGIRVGVAAAKGYAMALGLPLVGLTSLEILRLGCRAAGPGAVVPVVDLRRGEVAWSPPLAPEDEPAERHGPPDELAAERHGPPDELAAELAAHLEGARDGTRSGSGAGDVVVLAGDGALRYAAMLSAASPGRVIVAGPELAVPPVASLVRAGAAVLAAGGGCEPAQVNPRYLREADVRINWTTRHDAPGRSVEVA